MAILSFILERRLTYAGKRISEQTDSGTEKNV